MKTTILFLENRSSQVNLLENSHSWFRSLLAYPDWEPRWQGLNYVFSQNHQPPHKDESPRDWLYRWATRCWLQPLEYIALGSWVYNTIYLWLTANHLETIFIKSDHAMPFLRFRILIKLWLTANHFKIHHLATCQP